MSARESKKAKWYVVVFLSVTFMALSLNAWGGSGWVAEGVPPTERPIGWCGRDPQLLMMWCMVGMVPNWDSLPAGYKNNRSYPPGDWAGGDMFSGYGWGVAKKPHDPFGHPNHWDIINVGYENQGTWTEIGGGFDTPFIAKNLGATDFVSICPAVPLRGNPINVVTGNKYQKEVDLIPGPTPNALDFTRHYNSQFESLRPMGYGWRHTYDRYLTFTADNIKAWREDGRAVYFSASTLQPESGARERLVQNPDGTYVLTRPDDVQEHYESGGKLLSITDLNSNTQTLTYDGSGNLTTVTDPFGRSLSFTYDGSGRIGAFTDPAGNTISFVYDASDNLTQVIYPGGSTKIYHYEDGNDVHNLTGITNENGIRFATFAYALLYEDQDRATLSTHAEDVDMMSVSYDDLVTTVTDARGNTTTFNLRVKEEMGLLEQLSGQGCSDCGGSTSKQFTYDANLNVASMTDANGITTNYTYDADGNMLSSTEAVGTPDERTIAYTYVAGLHKIASITQLSVQAGESKITTFTYDGNGNLTQRTDSGYSAGTPFSHTTTYQYNSRGQITQIDGPRGDVSDVTTFTYDTQGNLASVTRGGTLTTTYSNYNGYSSPGGIIDPNGVETVLGYDARNRLSSVTTSAGSTSYTYDPAGNLSRIDLPNGNQLHYTFDDANRMIQVSDGRGNTINYGYDAAGNRTSEEIRDPSGTLSRTLSYEYDSFNRLLKVLYPDSAEEVFGYDGNGNRTSATDGEGRTTTYTYDSLNRVKEVLQPGNVTTEYAYDSADNLVSVTDAENHLTAYAYDDAGRLLQTISPDTGTTQYTYDEAGNLTSKTDAQGVTVSYTYDSLNRLTMVDYPIDSDVLYSYDEGTYGKGRLTGMIDGSGN